MTEIIDQANELVEMTIQHAINNRPAPLPFSGKCRNCEETISVGSFCDADCRNDFELRRKNERK